MISTPTIMIKDVEGCQAFMSGFDHGSVSTGQNNSTVEKNLLGYFTNNPSKKWFPRDHAFLNQRYQRRSIELLYIARTLFQCVFSIWRNKTNGSLWNPRTPTQCFESTRNCHGESHLNITAVPENKDHWTWSCSMLRTTHFLQQSQQHPKTLSA